MKCPNCHLDWGTNEPPPSDAPELCSQCVLAIADTSDGPQVIPWESLDADVRRGIVQRTASLIVRGYIDRGDLVPSLSYLLRLANLSGGMHEEGSCDEPSN